MAGDIRDICDGARALDISFGGVDAPGGFRNFAAEQRFSERSSSANGDVRLAFREVE